MNRRGLIFIMVGLLAAIAAAAVVYNLSNNLAQRTGNVVGVGVATPVSAQNLRKIVVARTLIDRGQLLVTETLTLVDWPTDSLPGGYYTSTAEMIDATAQVPLLQGLPIVKGQFIDAEGRTGLSALIPKSKVLVAFPSTDILNSTGAVQAGDFVDILLTLPISGTNRVDASGFGVSQLEGGVKNLVAQVTLQNVEVYNTGNWSPPTADPQTVRSLKIITFIVDHQEALILKFVKDSGGIIDLVVRSAQDPAIVKTDPVNLDYLADLYNFLGFTNPSP